MSSPKKPAFYLAMMGVTLVLSGGATFFLWNGIGEKKADVEALKKEIKPQEELEKELATANALVAESASKLQHLEKGVPNFAYVPTMLKELEWTGRENGIEVFGVRPIPTPVAPKKEGEDKPARKAYDEIAIEIRGRGNYRSIMNFVSALRVFPKIVAAKTVGMQPVANRVNGMGQVEDTRLDITIELRAFIFPVEEKDDKSDEVKS